MKYKTRNSENPVAEVPEEILEEDSKRNKDNMKRDFRNDHDDFYGDAYATRRDFEGK